jgi:hypothetical protein
VLGYKGNQEGGVEGGDGEISKKVIENQKYVNPIFNSTILDHHLPEGGTA